MHAYSRMHVSHARPNILAGLRPKALAVNLLFIHFSSSSVFLGIFFKVFDL